MAESMRNDNIEWLYPDLMSEEGLRFILRQRYVKHPTSDLESVAKEELVELYNQYILPLPQRKYRNNRNGQDASRKQMLFDKKLKRKISADDSEKPNTKYEKRGGPSSGLVNHFRSPHSVEPLLKPPPSAVNFEKKVIKLSSSKSPVAETNGLVIETWNKKVDGQVASESQVNSVGDAGKLDHPKKRQNTSTENGVNSKDLEINSPAKKISKITWP